MYVSACQEKCEPERTILEAIDLPCTVIIYDKYYYNRHQMLRLHQFFFGAPLCSQGGPSPSIPRPHNEISLFLSHSRWTYISVPEVPKLKFKANVNIKATRTDHESNTTSALMVRKNTCNSCSFS